MHRLHASVADLPLDIFHFENPLEAKMARTTESGLHVRQKKHEKSAWLDCAPPSETGVAGGQPACEFTELPPFSRGGGSGGGV